MRLTYLLLIALILAMIGYSCKHNVSKDLNQGEIHYNIEYKGIFGVPKEFLPRNLVLSFKKDKILWEMSGIANSGILNLSNPEKGIFDTYFSIPPVKYYYAGEAGESYPGFATMDNIIIKKTSKTTVLCGYNCKNAEVTFPSDSEKVYNIWYTDEIKIRNPNISTPFNQIDGVLMSFFFFIGSSEMHFDAEGVYPRDIPNETFERRDKFIRISRDDITKLINKLGNI